MKKGLFKFETATKKSLILRTSVFAILIYLAKIMFDGTIYLGAGLFWFLLALLSIWPVLLVFGIIFILLLIRYFGKLLFNFKKLGGYQFLAINISVLVIAIILPNPNPIEYYQFKLYQDDFKSVIELAEEEKLTQMKSYKGQNLLRDDLHEIPDSLNNAGKIVSIYNRDYLNVSFNFPSYRNIKYFSDSTQVMDGVGFQRVRLKIDKNWYIIDTDPM